MDKLNIIKELLSRSEEDSLVAELEKLKNKRIAIYGAGSFGKEFLSLLRKNGITVECFFDRNAGNINSIDGVEVVTLDEYSNSKNDITVILTIVCDKDIRRSIIADIKKAGFIDIMEAQSIRCHQVAFSDGYEYKNAFERVKKAYSMMSDEKSRQIFLDNVYAHLSRDYSDCGSYEEKMAEQYFPSDLKPTCGYSAFVDCGGFIGDTVDSLMKITIPKRVVSFEPMINNYIRLTESCRKYEDTETEFSLFNNAVSDRVKQVSFASGTGSGSISQAGDVLITAVSLDDALGGFRPTFIKMDIEGEEINAICGAQRMIRYARPDMAICVYHNIDHLWEIPLLINSISEGYDFYLRSYNSFTMETVLYAFQKKEE